MNINNYGFIRVAAASPKVRVADCDFNLQQIKSTIADALLQNVQILCFPELSITAYTCADLFFQDALQKKALESVAELRDYLKDKPSIIVIVGLPLQHQNALYNVACVLSSEGILGIVPKSHIPNHGDLYEKRWFSSAHQITDTYIEINGEFCDIIPDGLVFNTPHGNFGVEISEDLWAPVAPSTYLARQGADIIFNLAANNDVVGKNEYRKSLILMQSAKCAAAYVYASAGCGESTTDAVFSGASYIAENGNMLQESRRFSMENELIIADIDIAALRNERLRKTDFATYAGERNEIFCQIDAASVSKMYRTFNPHPFIPSKETENETLNEVFNIQTNALAKRILHTGSKTITIGVSGGLDSTLALLVLIKTFDLLGLPRKNIIGITMPGFGTTDRTYTNAVELMKSAGVTAKEISIVKAVTQHLKDIEHDINIHDVTYENAQARERTQILMDYANKTGGFVLGTGNLSELALGWATYNGDHMSMYAVNASVPKTLVKTLVRWIADTQMEKETAKILHDIVDTPFSPELLPADKEGKIAQKTENYVGPYELHDFFLHRMLRYGDNPKRVYFMARHAFAEMYSPEEILKWLRVFYKRFFAQQFKRSCMPDGPKVGSVSLSPRGDWRMPSDAVAKVWMDELNDKIIS